MAVLVVISIVIGLLSGVFLVLMFQDTEIQRKIFRRYVKQIDEYGRIRSEVKWGDMKYGFFIRSGWLYRMPSQEERPELAHYPELVAIREKIRLNWKVMPWLLCVLLVCAATCWLSI